MYKMWGKISFTPLSKISAVTVRNWTGPISGDRSGAEDFYVQCRL